MDISIKNPTYIKCVRLRGRYGIHLLVPIREDEETVEYILKDTYYLRLIGDDFKYPESIDPDGGPFMSIGSTIYDMSEPVAIIDKFDCTGKYTLLECHKLSYSTTPPAA